MAGLLLAAFVATQDLTALEIDLVSSRGASSADEHVFQGRLQFVPTGGANLESLEPREVAVRGTGVVAVDLPPRTWWTVRADFDGWWAQPQVVAGDADTLSLLVHPAGTAVVSVATARSAAPEALAVGFSSAREMRRTLPGDLAEEPQVDPFSGWAECSPIDALEPRPRWHCELPAGRPLDLKLRAKGFAAVFFWSVELPRSKPLDLGTVELTPGGSVIGWVETTASATPEAITVRLSPASAGVPNARRRTLERAVPVGRGGFFQVDDLAAGVYEIELNHPGWPASRHGTVEVLAGRETELRRPLRLRLPATVRLCVEPSAIPGFRLPQDSWQIRLNPPEGEFRDPLHGNTGQDGCWVQEGVAPGQYQLVVRDDRGSRWAEAGLIVPEGPFDHRIELDLLEIAGTVRRLGEPTRAVLHFKKVKTLEDGQPADLIVVAITDLEGHLATALPEPGVWQVAARLRQDGALHDLGTHDIRRPEDGEATVDLEIPAGRVEGRVVTEAGDAVAHASVSAWPIGVDDPRYSTTETDSKGHFAFDALVPGQYQVSALAPDGTAQLAVRVEEEQPATVRLVLTEVRPFTGRIVGEHGPVPGASVLIYPRVSRPRPIPVVRRTTGHDGTFQASLPVDATLLDIVVLPPGYSAAAFRLAPPAREAVSSLDLIVTRFGGTLILRSEASNLLLNPGSLYLDGHEIWLPLLDNWARLGGGSVTARAWVIPHLEPGDYRWCPAPDRCTSGSLSPLGTLELTTE